jgi:BolA family transcriptional regulator, general stress-responsive regulator
LTEHKTHLSRASRIETLLRERFSPVHFVLTDQSSAHAGHAGARPGGETHYHLAMHDTLREEFDTGLHALTLDLRTPGA